VKNGNRRKKLEKRSRGRPKQMMLDWMMVEGYKKLKEEAETTRGVATSDILNLPRRQRTRRRYFHTVTFQR